MKRLLPFASLLAVGCVQEYDIQSWSPERTAKASAVVTSVSQDSLYSLTGQISSPRHFPEDSVHLKFVRNIITGRLAKFGFSVEEQTVPGKTSEEPTIIGIRKGKTPGTGAVLLIAHWDSVEGTPGADDNGAACALLLETARVLAGTELSKDLILLFPAFEEEGMTGAYHFFRTWTGSISAAVNFDAVAFTSPYQKPIPFFPLPENGNYIALISPEWGASLGYEFASAADLFCPELNYSIMTVPENLYNSSSLSGTTRSDHLPLWEQKKPALFATDMADYRNDRYHTVGDSVETLDFPFLTALTKTTAAAAVLWAD